MTDAVQPTTDNADQTTYIAVGVAVVLGLLVVATCSVVLVVWLVRLVKRKQGLLTRVHTVVYMATLTSLVCTLVYAYTGDGPSKDMRSFE